MIERVEFEKLQSGFGENILAGNALKRGIQNSACTGVAVMIGLAEDLVVFG